MRPTILFFSSLKKWLMLALAGSLLMACNDAGRDPILGADGNVALAPTVVMVTPANNATDVTITNPAITAEFSGPIAALSASSFTVTCASPCAAASGTIEMSAANTVATFVMAEADLLEPLTEYTATIHNATSSVNGLAMDSPFIWRFTTGPAPSVDEEVDVAPTVIMVTPENNATNVDIANPAITAEFNEPVANLTDTDFTVTCASPCTNASGTIEMSAENTVATFNLAEFDTLEPLTEYTATIHNATSSESGVIMEDPYIWEFTTGRAPDTTRPRVVATNPLTTDPGPTPDVPANTAISATFSEEMLATTINDTSFTVTCELPCESPAGAVSYSSGSNSAVFTPEEDLAEGATYTATVTSDATDLAGNKLAGNQAPSTSASDYIWAFTTVAAIEPEFISVLSTDPIDGGVIAVCENASINATFDIPSGLRLNPETVNNMTFLIVENNEPTNTVAAESIKLDLDTGTIMTFIPESDLVEGMTYRATIVGGEDGVKDLMLPGNQLEEDFVWTFTSEEPVDGCLQPANLASAAPFGSFGGSAGVTNQGLLTVVNGDLGTTATSTLVTGFVSEPGCEYTITTLNEGQVNGKIFTSPPPPTVACPQDGTAATEAIAIQARLDAEDAFIALSPANMPGGQDPGNDNLGNLTLTPDIYTAQSGSFMIQGGDLTLDAQGNQNAVWVFQMATTLTVGGPGADFPQSVTLINGAQAKNIFWQVGSAATINAAGGGTMKGTIIAQDGVSISTADNVNIVTLDGRALSLTASVTVVNTVINVPAE
ncbi:MAG: ice-binding family protein [Idiomarina sp.]|nr:ice-binding family protein [Idiomarina sp.]